MDEPELIELLTVKDVYADGIGAVEPLSGDNFRTTYFAYQRLPGSLILTRVAVCKLVRPRSSLVPNTLRDMLNEWPTGNDEDDGHT